MDRVITVSVLLMSIFLNGCWWDSNTKPPVPVIQIQTVEVPVFKCPSNYQSINIPTRPTLSVQTLTEQDKMDAGKVVHAYRVDLTKLIQYSQSLELGMDTYRNICMTADSPTLESSE
jgi:hypothetical protein